MIKYLSLKQVLLIHTKMIEKYGGTQGVRDQNLLESAIVRPRMSAFGEDAYPTLTLKAAVLLHSLIKNHPFLDGNKRTAFGAMHLTLLINRHDLTSSTDQEVEMCLHTAEGKMTEKQIADWIETRVRKIK